MQPALRFQALSNAASAKIIDGSGMVALDNELRTQAQDYRRRVAALEAQTVSCMAALSPPQPWSRTLVAGLPKEDAGAAAGSAAKA